jgi:CBS domain-containing protein
MAKGGFRHLIVIDGGEIAGMLSVRDIVKRWTQDGATSEMTA